MKKRAFIYSALLLLSGVIVTFPANANDAKGLERLQQAPKFQQENKVAVIVGINAYDRSTGLRPLRYAAADANNLRNTLIRQGYKVRLLTNQQAGKYRILDAIEQAGKTLRRGTGTFLFAYSGHGFASRKRNYLASHGTVVNKLSQSALPLSEVQQAIRRTGAKRAMLFIDACRNDPNIAGSKTVGNMGFIYTKSQGMKTLYATKFGEVSWESPQLRHGVFSHFLIKALRGEAADANGIISFGTVENYVQKNVSSWTFDHKMPNTQLPFSNGNSFGVLVLGNKRGFKPTPISFTPQPQPIATSRHKNQPQVVNHYHGQKGHPHALPNNSIQHRHGQGVVGSASKLQVVARPQHNPPRIAQSTNRQNSSGTASLHAVYKRKDYATLFRLAKPLAKKGNSTAQAYLGRLYEHEIYDSKKPGDIPYRSDYPKAIKWYRKSAAQGNAMGQVHLGYMYSSGRGGVMKNKQKAIELYKKSAAQGYAKAQLSLGYNFEYGIGVKRNIPKAIDLYRQAARQGNTAALNNLGAKYRQGKGVTKNYHKALELFRKAATKKNKYAYYNLGLMYEKGQGVTKDLVQAKKWFRKATLLGHKQASKRWNALGG